MTCSFVLLLLLGTSAALLSPVQHLLQSASSQKGILLPGVFDALSSKSFERQGAPVLFLSGFGVSAMKLGDPDAGIITHCEMEETTRHACSSVKVPLFVDGDTGYGGTATMRRAIRGLVAAGAAAITIEDQVCSQTLCLCGGRVGGRSRSFCKESENGVGVPSRSSGTRWQPCVDWRSDQLSSSPGI